MRKMVFAMGLIAALALAGAAAADREQVHLTKAGQRAARAAVLRRGDLGSGTWTGTKKTPVLNPSIGCPGFHPKQSDLVVIGAAEMEWKSTAAQFDSSAQVLRTPKMVQLDWKRTVRVPQVLPCLRHNVAKSLAATERLSFVTRLPCHGHHRPRPPLPHRRRRPRRHGENADPDRLAADREGPHRAHAHDDGALLVAQERDADGAASRAQARPPRELAPKRARRRSEACRSPRTRRSPPRASASAPPRRGRGRASPASTRRARTRARRPSGCVISSASRSTVSSLRRQHGLAHEREVGRRHDDRREAGLDRVRAEDVAEARREHDAKP